MYCEHCYTRRLKNCLVFKQDTTKSLHFFQAEDLVAHFFPKKLLELDHFLKVGYMFFQLSVYC